MKIETKGLFEALPNCMTLQDIIEYLDMRNSEERIKQEEHHEIYEEGSIILNNLIRINCEEKNRAQILYSEFQRPPMLTKDYIIHQPSWLITPDTRSNTVWVKGSVICNFSKHEETISDCFIGQIKCKKSIKRTYIGITRCPYTDLSTGRIEIMLKESINNIKYVNDEVLYNVFDNTEITNITLPIIMKG